MYFHFFEVIYWTCIVFPCGVIFFPWFFIIPVVLCRCLHIWKSSSLFQTLQTDIGEEELSPVGESKLWFRVWWYMSPSAGISGSREAWCLISSGLWGPCRRWLLILGECSKPPTVATMAFVFSVALPGPVAGSRKGGGGGWSQWCAHTWLWFGYRYLCSHRDWLQTHTYGGWAAGPVAGTGANCGTLAATGALVVNIHSFGCRDLPWHIHGSRGQ